MQNKQWKGRTGMSSAVRSLRESADQKVPSRSKAPSRQSFAPQQEASRSFVDMMLYLLLGFLIYAAWQLSRLPELALGTDLSYWIGVAGATMMLLLFTYPLRKHLRFMHQWGKVKWWFIAHMMLGIGGPILILIHSTFKIGSLNAGVALISMVIVALSGVVGRFLRARVHLGLHGEMTTLRELQARAGFDQKDARSRLAFAPEVEELLQDFERRELEAETDMLTHLRQVFVLPLQRWFTYNECCAALSRPLRKIAKHRGWDAEELADHDRLARKLIRRYIDGVVRVAQFTAYERVFALWHVAHVPFVYLLVASSVVHIIAVHAY
jgi:hypothetical protein